MEILETRIMSCSPPGTLPFLYAILGRVQNHFTCKFTEVCVQSPVRFILLALRMWFSGEHSGGAGLVVAFDDLKNIFQLQ